MKHGDDDAYQTSLVKKCCLSLSEELGHR